MFLDFFVKQMRHIEKYISPSSRWAKKSYSQTGEDLLISFLFKYILKIEKPGYIDIGAFDPFRFSNTAIFYKQGSRGINIEPNPKQFKRFLRYRKRDINLNIGVSDVQSELEFYIMSSGTLCTFDKNAALEYDKQGKYRLIATKKIPVDTINNVVDKYCEGKFPEILSVDTEGTDEKLLASIDFSKSYPLVICVEGRDMLTCERESEIPTILKDAGYILYADTCTNMIFVRKDIFENALKSLS